MPVSDHQWLLAQPAVPSSSHQIEFVPDCASAVDGKAVQFWSQTRWWSGMIRVQLESENCMAGGITWSAASSTQLLSTIRWMVPLAMRESRSCSKVIIFQSCNRSCQSFFFFLESSMTSCMHSKRQRMYHKAHLHCHTNTPLMMSTMIRDVSACR